MKKFLFIGLASLAVVVNYNCKKSEISHKVIKLNLPATAFDYSLITTPFGVQDVFYENSQLIKNDMATIGRVLFYDKALSLNNSVSCATCHKQENAFADVVPLSKGFEEKLTHRNSIGINNLRDEVGIGYFWDAREQMIESMVLAPVANHIEMGFERFDLIAQKLSNLPYYPELFKKHYGDENVTTERIRECLGNFLFSIISANSKFDDALANSFKDFTAQEINGMNIFTSNSCNTCHLINRNFSSSYGQGIEFANNGLDKVNIDEGLNGFYKIPRLNNVAKTAPYMHDGRFKSLDEVIEHYSHNIQDNQHLSSFLRASNNTPLKLNLSESEKQDLIAFLQTLNDDVVTTDPKFSSPFIN